MTAAALTAPRHRIPAGAVLGTDISSATSVDEALTLARLEWELDLLAADHLTVLAPSGVISTGLPERKLLVRTDTHLTLAAVGSRYTPVDNRSAFALADAAHAMGATFAHAGERDHGRSVFLTMDLPEARVQVGGNDIVDFGVIFEAGHGGASVTGRVTGKRLVCMNGMTVGIGSPISWSIPHTASALQRLTLAENTLRGATRYAKEFAAIAEHLISTPMSLREFTAYIDRLYPQPDPESKAAHTRWVRRRGDLLDLFRVAPTQEQGRDTAWGALNAVIEWEDWSRPVRKGNSPSVAAARAARQFTDSDAGVRQHAFNLLTAA
jgi:phage/plasmid-like protein (TIGR03299 family)